MMEVVTWFFTVVAVCLFLFVLYSTLVMWRTGRVYRFRGVLINEISSANKRDIDFCMTVVDILRLVPTLNARWEWFGLVSFDKMVYDFWRPLASFYPDREKVLSADWMGERGK